MSDNKDISEFIDIPAIGILGSESTIEVSEETVASLESESLMHIKKFRRKFSVCFYIRSWWDRTRGSMVDHQVTHRVKFLSQL